MLPRLPLNFENNSPPTLYIFAAISEPSLAKLRPGSDGVFQDPCGIILVPKCFFQTIIFMISWGPAAAAEDH